MKKRFRRINFSIRRGQLNIAEVVVSAAIILVLTISIAQLGSQITVSQDSRSESLSSLREKADQLLQLALDQGLLRNITYTNTSDPDFVRMQTELTILISSGLPATVEFSLYQNSLDESNFRLLAGLNPVPSSGTLVSASVFVGGITNTAIVDHSYYIITLIIAVGELN